MPGNARLGIELEITSTTAVNTIDKLLDSIKGIQAALKDLGFDNITKAANAMGNVASSVQGSSKAFTDIKKDVDSAAASITKLNEAAGKGVELKIVGAEKWPEFLKNNMAAFMAFYNGHKNAMPKLGEAWKDYNKAATQAASGISAGLDSTIKSAANLKETLSKGATLKVDTAAGIAAVSDLDKVVKDLQAKLGSQTLSILKNTATGGSQANKYLDPEYKERDERAKQALSNYNDRVKDTANIARIEKAALNARMSEEKAAIQAANNQEDQMNAMFRLDKLAKDKAALRQRTSDIKQAITEELAAEKRKQEQIDAMHRVSLASIPKPIKSVDGNSLTLFARDQQAKVVAPEVSAKAISDITKLSNELQKLGSVSIAQASSEIQKLGINIKGLSFAEFNNADSILKKFGLTVNRTSGEIQALKTSTDKLKNGFFSFLPDTVGKMAARLAEFYSIRMVIFAVTAQFRDATKAALDLNQGVHDILAISGESKDQFKAVSDSIYEIAKSSRFTTTEVIGLMQVLAQAGVKAKDLGQVSAETGKFATATASDPKMAADLVTTAMNVFDIKAEKVTRVTNAMTAALNLSKLETAGLATAFSYLAPQAAQLGMSMEQSLGIVANMAQSGIKPSTIGTGVSQMLKEFAAPKPRLRKMLEAYGIDEDSINPMKNQFADIVQTLQTAKVSVADLFAAMETRVGRSAVTAINLSAESFREMEANLTGTHAALIAYDKTMEGARARMNVVKQTFGELATTVGESLAPAFVTLTEMLKGTLILFGAADGSLSKIVVGLVAVTAAIYPLISAARALTATGAILAGFSTGGVAVAIGAIVVAVGGLLYALNATNRAKEAAKKLELEELDRGERLDRTLNSITNSTKESSAAYKKYQDALKSGKSVQEALAVVDNKYIEIKSEQKAALQKYIAEGGPHALYIEKLLKEKDVLTAIVALQGLRVSENNNKVFEGVQTYNNKADNLDKTRASRAQDQLGRFLDGTPKATSQLPKMIEEVKKQDKLTLQKYQSELNIQGGVLSNERGPAYDINFDPDTKRATIDAIPPPKEVNSKRIAGGKSAHGGAAPAPDATIKLDEARLKIAQEQLANIKSKAKDENVTLGEIQKLREEAISKLKVIRSLDEKLQIDKIKDEFFIHYNEKEPSKSTYRKDKDNKEVDKSEVNSLFKERVSLVKAKSDKDAQDTKNTFDADENKIEKTINAHVDSINRILIEADKKLQEAKIRNQDKIVSSAYSSHTARATAARILLEAEYAKIEDDIKKEVDKLESDLIDDRKNISDDQFNARLASIAKVQSTATPRKQEIKETVDLKVLTGEKANTDLYIANTQKAADTKRAELAMQEKEAVGYDTLKQLQLQALQIEKDSLAVQEKKASDFNDFIQASSKEEDQKAQALEALNKIHQAQKNINYEIGEKSKEAWGNFKKGAADAYTQQTDTDKLSKDFGGNVTNTAFNGIAGSLSNSLGTLINPDTEKINDLKMSIAKLRQEKVTLETGINSIELNSSKTPQEIAQLNEKKVKLADVNNELNKQNQAVREQTSAWASFATGFKNVMKEILKELQMYIAKLMLVAVAKKLAGFAISAMSGGSSGPEGGPTIANANAGGDYLNSTILPASNYQQDEEPRFAEGGLVPMLAGAKAGVDSVRILSMPGEFVVKKSSVDFYGASNISALNDQKLPKFANGGIVGGNNGSGGAQGGGGKTEFTLQIVNLAPGETPKDPGENSKQIINVINNEILRRGSTYKTIKSVIQG